MYIMSRYDPEHKGATRRRILAAGERLIKRQGVDAATVAQTMQAAGLTVGGFYAHFGSKDELAREALLFGLDASFARLTAGLDDLDDRAWLRAMLRRYFAQLDERSLDEGCPLTLSLPEVARADDAARAEFGARAAALVKSVQHRFPSVAGMASPEVALAVFAALSGAVALARAVARPHVRPRVVAATEKMLYAMLGLGPVPSGDDAA
jgi:TetR/AcrR family transcriptional regulator, transcriptional repressor for nem operon